MFNNEYNVFFFLFGKRKLPEYWSDYIHCKEQRKIWEAISFLLFDNDDDDDDNGNNDLPSV